MKKKRPTPKYNKNKRRKDNPEFYSKNDIFYSRMASILKVSPIKIREIFSTRTVSTLRLNDLISDPQKIKSTLLRKGLRLRKVGWIDNTYIVPGIDKSELGKMHEYEKGLFYIQNLSSMIPPILIDPNPNDLILDMCAAPGSKTTQIASMLKNKGKIIANDDDAWRAQKLKSVLDMFNVKNTTITINKGEEIGNKNNSVFDKVLLDAPCSGEGLIYLKGEKPLRFWSIKKVKAMVSIQKKLIISAFKSLKKGGTLIYSTCTLEPDENEGVITYLLDNYNNAKVEDISKLAENIKKENFVQIDKGIIHWNGKDFSKEVRKSIRITPSAELMGFFVCKITKK